MNKSISVVHCIAHCEDCDWKAGYYKNAQALAARHAKTHHHKVAGDVGLYFVYDGREMKDEHQEAETHHTEKGEVVER